MRRRRSCCDITFSSRSNDTKILAPRIYKSEKRALDGNLDLLLRRCACQQALIERAAGGSLALMAVLPKTFPCSLGTSPTSSTEAPARAATEDLGELSHAQTHCIAGVALRTASNCTVPAAETKQPAGAGRMKVGALMAAAMHG